jgi:hypothetical protein
MAAATTSAVAFRPMARAPFKERLLTTYGSGKVYTEQLVFDAALALVDTHWVVTAYGDPDQPTLSEPGVVTTANFDADGTLSGTGGCNRYTATEIELDAIINPLNRILEGKIILNQ